MVDCPENTTACNVDDLVLDIRKGLNECKDTQPGCSCGERWSDQDIINAINYALDFLSNIRKELFTEVSKIELGEGCWHNICDLAPCCDTFISLNYSTNEPCYIPEEFCPGQGGKSAININPCLTFSTDGLDDETVIGYFVNPKNPCLLFVNREDETLTTEVSITCFKAPTAIASGGTLPQRACRYKGFIFNFAMFHLLARDHNDTQGYIELVKLYWGVATSMLGEVVSADALLKEKGKYLGRVFTKQECIE